MIRDRNKFQFNDKITPIKATQNDFNQQPKDMELSKTDNSVLLTPFPKEETDKERGVIFH